MRLSEATSFPHSLVALVVHTVTYPVDHARVEAEPGGITASMADQRLQAGRHPPPLSVPDSMHFCCIVTSLLTDSCAKPTGPTVRKQSTRRVSQRLPGGRWTRPGRIGGSPSSPCCKSRCWALGLQERTSLLAATRWPTHPSLMQLISWLV